jgi:hypothetical protein
MPSATSNTAYGIISDAMQDAGILQDGESPNSEQLSNNLRRLCDIVNLWQTQGLKLWLWEDIAIPLTEGVNSYILAPGGVVDMTKPLRGLQGYILSAVGNSRRPLTVMSWDEWMRLSQVTGNNGMVSSFFIDKKATQLIVYVWNPPDAVEATNSLHILLQTQAVNPVNLEEDMSFPQEWRIALRWALADDICTGQPQAIMDRCAQRAIAYREALENWDVEDAPTYFAVDSRMTQGRGRFR